MPELALADVSAGRGGNGSPPDALPPDWPSEFEAPEPAPPPVRQPHGIERRRIAEPYRQPFGVPHTQRYGRPIGWVVLMSAIEKVMFPTALLIMLILGAWEALVVTVAAETVIALTALVIVSRGQRLEYLFKGLLFAPMRYALLVFDAVTIARFTSDLWITRNRKWRK